MPSGYPYGLDPNYAASYMPPGAAPPPPTAAATGPAGGDDGGKGKEDSMGKGKEPTSPVDSSKVSGPLGGCRLNC